MDCEKFEATMLDELYGELDELTLAASKRHMGGCARCSTLMAGLRATRKLVTLPVLAPSEGFESRLLSAVQAAERKPSLGFAQLISLAGRWAMRPQTAMAAVFLLTVGTSSVLFSRHAPRKDSAFSSSMTVTENGAPAASAAGAPVSSPDLPLDPGAAAAAHGTPVAANGPAAPRTQPAAQTAAPTDESSNSDKLFAVKAPSKRAAGRASSLDDLDPALSRTSGGGAGGASENSVGHASAGFAPPPPPPVAPATPAAAPGPFATSTPPAPAEESAKYRQGDYPSQSVDGKNAAADPTTVLQAARLVRDGAGGCQGAVGRFDQVASGSWGSGTGYEATLEGAQCYAQLGQSDSARSRYQRLLTVPAYAARAQAAINSLGPPMVASRKAAKPVAAAPKADEVAPSASAAPAPAAKPTPTEK